MSGSVSKGLYKSRNHKAQILLSCYLIIKNSQRRRGSPTADVPVNMANVAGGPLADPHPLAGQNIVDIDKGVMGSHCKVFSRT